MRTRAPSPARLRRDARINVELPAEVYAGLLAQAQAQNLTLSVVVRGALTYYQEHCPTAKAFRRPSEAAS